MLNYVGFEASLKPKTSHKVDFVCHRRGQDMGLVAQAKADKMTCKESKNSVVISLKLFKNVNWPGNISKDPKNHFGWVGRGMISKDCLATEWVDMLFKTDKK